MSLTRRYSGHRLRGADELVVRKKTGQLGSVENLRIQASRRDRRFRKMLVLQSLSKMRCDESSPQVGVFYRAGQVRLTIEVLGV